MAFQSRGLRLPQLAGWVDFSLPQRRNQRSFIPSCLQGDKTKKEKKCMTAANIFCSNNKRKMRKNADAALLLGIVRQSSSGLSYYYFELLKTYMSPVSRVPLKTVSCPPFKCLIEKYIALSISLNIHANTWNLSLFHFHFPNHKASRRSLSFFICNGYHCLFN